jgi:ribosomal protein S18 acetylase RimI-like enzyme
MSLSLRLATDADFAFCETLNRTNMAAYFQARGMTWDSARFLASWMQFENRILERDGVAVGALRLLEVDGALEIRDLQLVASHRGRGIGGWAIAQAQASARARGMTTLRLRVYADNPAQRLYARNGFTVERIDAGVVHMVQVLRDDA